jgi:Xaa-Pro aminopeptidase
VAGVVEAINASLQAAGFSPRASGHISHGLGLQSTEPPDVSLTDPTILAPGMVITVEPALIYDHGIYQTEQNIAVTQTGHEVLTHGPWQIPSFG